MARNYVSLKDESVRIFKNPILDLFSRVHWSVPLFFWVPVVMISLYKGFSSGVSILETVLLFIAALGFWTLAEYVLHRYIFHFHPTTDIGKRISFLTHGVHHDFPNDSKRLVMPPLLGSPLAALFYFAFYFVLGERYVFPFFAGFISGYLVYDMMHYAIHHSKSSNRFFQEIKKHHMVHHFNDAESGYGVSSKIWDVAFGSLFVPKSKEKTIEQRVN